MKTYRGKLQGQCLVVLTVSLLIMSGCDSLKSLTALPKPKKVVRDVKVIETIESPELAKLILQPKSAPLDVSRDPFYPLFSQELDPGQDVMAQSDLTDIKFLGVIKLDGGYAAYLKSPKQKGVFRVNDRFRDYVIEDIQDKKVVFRQGTNIVTLKRGEKK